MVGVRWERVWKAPGGHRCHLSLNLGDLWLTSSVGMGRCPSTVYHSGNPGWDAFPRECQADLTMPGAILLLHSTLISWPSPLWCEQHLRQAVGKSLQHPYKCTSTPKIVILKRNTKHPAGSFWIGDDFLPPSLVLIAFFLKKLSRLDFVLKTDQSTPTLGHCPVGCWGKDGLYLSHQDLHVSVIRKYRGNIWCIFSVLKTLFLLLCKK